MRRVLLPVTLALVPVTARASDLAADRDPSAIYGGGPVQQCGWPSTVFVNDCTGTLVHPNVVVLAAHCVAYGGQAQSVVFGEDHRYGARVVPVEGCVAYEGWTEAPPGDNAGDIALCTLAQSVIDVPVVPILMGCETDALAPGVNATLVGFGDADDALGYGPKREVTTQIQQVGNDAVFIGGGGQSSCYGDSGGPAFVQLDDGSWRVFGATSGSATNEEGCGQTGVWTMIHPYVGWIEQTSGYDVTPCHDTDGAWNPSEACSAFPMAPGSNGGSWGSGCAGEASGISETCGPGFGASAEDTGELPSDDDGGGAGSTGHDDEHETESGDEGTTGDEENDDEDDEDDGSGLPPSTPLSAGATASRGDTDADAGCACSTSSRAIAPWLLLLGLPLVRGRARRAS